MIGIKNVYQRLEDILKDGSNIATKNLVELFDLI